MLDFRTLSDMLFPSMSGKPPKKPGILEILQSPGLREFAVLRLNLAMHLVNDRAERFALERFDIPMRQVWIMAAALEGKRSQLSLADMLGIDPNVMVIHIDTLERRGLVRRKRNPKDRREQLITLTPKGSKLIRAARRIKDTAYRKIFEGLSGAEVRKALKMAERLLKAAKN